MFFQCDSGEPLFSLSVLNPTLFLNRLSEGAERGRGEGKREGLSSKERMFLLCNYCVCLLLF